MDEKEKELFDYDIYMLERGDSLGAIRTYPKKRSDNLEFISKTMEVLEEQNRISIENQSPELMRIFPSINLIIGALFIGAGAYVPFTFQVNGVIGIMPLILFGIGFMAIVGMLRY